MARYRFTAFVPEGQYFPSLGLHAEPGLEFETALEPCSEFIEPVEEKPTPRVKKES